MKTTLSFRALAIALLSCSLMTAQTPESFSKKLFMSAGLGYYPSLGTTTIPGGKASVSILYQHRSYLAFEAGFALGVDHRKDVYNYSPMMGNSSYESRGNNGIITLGLVAQLPNKSRWTPYVRAGVGISPWGSLTQTWKSNASVGGFVPMNVTESKVKTTVGPSLYIYSGVGVKYRVTPRVFIFAEMGGFWNVVTPFMKRRVVAYKVNGVDQLATLSVNQKEAVYTRHPADTQATQPAEFSWKNDNANSYGLTLGAHIALR